MPRKLEILLPFLDPRYVSEHPANHIPTDIRNEDQKKWLVDLTPAQQRREQKKWLDTAMEEWNPPHVLRSWESDPEIAERYIQATTLILPPRTRHPFEDLMVENPKDSSLSRIISKESYNPSNDPNNTDFRHFMHMHFHVGYHRFHATHGEPNLPSEETDPNVPPEDICWIMEYTEIECSIIRRKLAWRMGLFPAVIDPRTDVFDEAIADRYGVNRDETWGRRLYVRCRRRNKRCLRPTHLQIFASNFQDLP